MSISFKTSSILPASATLIVLLAGLALFDSSVVTSRYPLTELSHYGPGDSVLALSGKVHGFDAAGYALIRDSFGAVVATNLERGSLEKNQSLLVSGVMDGNGRLLARDVEVYPYRFWKYAVSLPALFFVLWRLFQAVEYTPRGLRLRTEPRSSKGP